MKGAEKLTEKSAEHAFENRSKIVEKVKGLLVGEELTMLNLLEEDPKNEFLQGKVKDVLKPKLEENPKTAEEINELIIKQKQLFEGETKNFNYQDGETNINIQGNQNSPINFNKD